MVDIRRYEGFAEIPIERYDGLLIDLDDTLYRYEPCHRTGIDAAFSDSRPRIGRIVFCQAVSRGSRRRYSPS